MPSSTWVHTSTVQDLIWKYQPKSVLDIGIGFGRWGFLIREQMDCFRGFYQKTKWRTRIVGIEAFPQYIQSHQHWLYDKIYIWDVMDYFKENEEKFDLIIAGDVLEHFEKDKGRQFIEQAYSRAKKALILNIPFGPGYPQGETFGNRFEAHKSTWDENDFRHDTRVTRTTIIKERIKHRPYAVVLMEK